MSQNNLNSILKIIFECEAEREDIFSGPSGISYQQIVNTKGSHSDNTIKKVLMSQYLDNLEKMACGKKLVKIVKIVQNYIKLKGEKELNILYYYYIHSNNSLEATAIAMKTPLSKVQSYVVNFLKYIEKELHKKAKSGTK